MAPPLQAPLLMIKYTTKAIKATPTKQAITIPNIAHPLSFFLVSFSDVSLLKTIYYSLLNEP